MTYRVELAVSCWGTSSEQALDNIRYYGIPQGFDVEIHPLDETDRCSDGWRHHRLRVAVEAKVVKALEATIVVARLEDRFRGGRKHSQERCQAPSP